MKFNSLSIAGATLAFDFVDALKVGLLSDLHLHLRYDPMIGPRVNAEGDCMAGSGVPSSEKAPMGRYGCDSPTVLIEQMLARFNEKFGKQDVILLTGDFAAHHVAMPANPEEAETTYALLLETLGFLNEMIAYKFPDTIILPAFGNNDSKYHDNPIPDQDAPYFYTYVYNLWFKLLPGNQKLLSDEQLKSVFKTFEIGGYYRVDLTDNISVLCLNTLYYDSERTKTDSTQSGVQQMFWLQDQLDQAEEGRKFIIIQHVYGGARYNNHPMWFSYPNKVYFELLRDHKDKIIIEVGGHDHFTSMRYSTEHEILDTSFNAAHDQSLFHNILVCPSMTPWYNNNPAVSAMEVDDSTLIPHNLAASYLNLRPTIGLDQRTPYSELEWRDLDYKTEFGIDELTALGIHDLRIRLQNDQHLQLHFMIKKLGLDPENIEERESAINIFMEKGLMNPETESTWSQICLMAKNLSTGEYASCLVRDPWSTPLYFTTPHDDSSFRSLEDRLKSSDYLQ